MYAPIEQSPNDMASDDTELSGLISPAISDDVQSSVDSLSAELASVLARSPSFARVLEDSVEVEEEEEGDDDEGSDEEETDATDEPSDLISPAISDVSVHSPPVDSLATVDSSSAAELAAVLATAPPSLEHSEEVKEARSSPLVHKLSRAKSEDLATTLDLDPASEPPRWFKPLSEGEQADAQRRSSREGFWMSCCGGTASSVIPFTSLNDAAWIARFDQPCARHTLCVWTALAGATMASKFFLSATCDAQEGGLRWYMAAVTTIIFWGGMVLLVDWVFGVVRHRDKVVLGSHAHTLHVRLIGQHGCEDWATLAAVFSRFGEVLPESSKIVHREQDGKNTSWAVVTMSEPEEMEAALDACVDTILSEGPPLTVTKYEHVRAREDDNFNAAMHHGEGPLQALLTIHASTGTHKIGRYSQRLGRHWRFVTFCFVYFMWLYFAVVGYACIELLVRDRRHPESLPYLAAEFHSLFVGDCLPRDTANAMLWMTLVFTVPAGIAMAVVCGWMMLAIGFAAVLVTDHIKELREVIRDKHFPRISPIISRDESQITDSVISSGAFYNGDRVRPEWTRGQEAAIRFHNALRKQQIPKEDLRLMAHIAAQKKAPDVSIDWCRLDRLLELCLEKRVVGADWWASNADVSYRAAEDAVLECIGWRLIATPRDLVQNEPAWEIEARRPAVQLVRTVLPMLARFEYCTWTFFFSISSLSLAMIPFVSSSANCFALVIMLFRESSCENNSFLYSIGIDVLLITLWITHHYLNPILTLQSGRRHVTACAVAFPLLMVVPMAIVGTQCNKLLGDLNDLRRLRLNSEEGYRVESLRLYLREANNGGGIGAENPLSLSLSLSFGKRSVFLNKRDDVCRLHDLGRRGPRQQNACPDRGWARRWARLGCYFPLHLGEHWVDHYEWQRGWRMNSFN